jgi:hypothetical protein
VKKFFYIFIVLGLFACNSNIKIVRNPTNKSFYKNSENSEATFYLCYIDSEPKIKNTIDSVVIDNYAYKFERNDISNFEMLVFDIIAVEFFMGKKAYKINQIIHNNIGQAMPNREFYLTRCNKIYFLVDKNKKEDIKLKKLLFRNYKNKTLIIIQSDYFIEPEGKSKPMISSQIYELGRNTTFNHLIRIE